MILPFLFVSVLCWGYTSDTCVLIFPNNLYRVSEYLELEQIVAPDDNETLRTLLTCSFPMYGHSKRDLYNPTKKFFVSDNFSRPGYSNESQFACRRCGKRYRWKSTMRRHEQVECGNKEPNYQCPYCPYKAKQKGNLGVHMRKHHSHKNI